MFRRGVLFHSLTLLWSLILLFRKFCPIEYLSHFGRVGYLQNTVFHITNFQGCFCTNRGDVSLAPAAPAPAPLKWIEIFRHAEGINQFIATNKFPQKHSSIRLSQIDHEQVIQYQYFSHITVILTGSSFYLVHFTTIFAVSLCSIHPYLVKRCPRFNQKNTTLPAHKESNPTNNLLTQISVELQGTMSFILTLASYVDVL